MSTRSLGSLAKAIVERAIANCPSRADQIERVQLARECGIFSDREADEWLAVIEARAA